VNSQEQ